MCLHVKCPKFINVYLVQSVFVNVFYLNQNIVISIQCSDWDTLIKITGFLYYKVTQHGIVELEAIIKHMHLFILFIGLSVAPTS